MPQLRSRYVFYATPLIIILVVIALFWTWGRAYNRVKIGDDYLSTKRALLAEYSNVTVFQTEEGEDVKVTFGCWPLRRELIVAGGWQRGQVVNMKFLKVVICGKWFTGEGQYMEPGAGVKNVHLGFSAE